MLFQLTYVLLVSVHLIIQFIYIYMYIYIYIANIFVGFQERRLFHKFPQPFIYLRYVDDTFVSFRSRSDALAYFFDILNQLHSSLTFTMEEENNGQLPF